MSNTFKLEQCNELISEAIEQDNAGKYKNALSLYEAAIGILNNRLKNEKRDDVALKLQQKIYEYTKRVQDIKLSNNIDTNDDIKSEQTIAHYMEEAVTVIKEAVNHDTAHKYHSALSLYSEGIDYLQIGASFEKNTKVKSAINDKIQKYTNRAIDLKNCYPYFQDIELKELSRRSLRNTKTGTYSWKIPHLSNKDITLLFHGYTRHNTLKYIPNDIINLCVLYYDIQLLYSMKNALNEEHFTSETFNIGALKWRMKIYPNGQKDSRKGHVILFLKLISLSPSIEQIVYYYDITVPQLKLSHWGFEAMFHGHLAYGWPKHTLLLTDIESLESMTFNIDITIVRINKGSLSMQNADIARNYGIYQWNISDVWSINKIRNASNMDKYESDVFKAIGFKWYLDFYPNGVDEEDINYTRFYLNILSLPTNIATVIVDYSVKCKELDIKRKWRQIMFTTDDPSSGLDDDVLIFSKIKDIASLSFEVLVELIDVYDKNGYAVTAEYEKENDINDKDNNFCVSGSYEWNITKNINIKSMQNAKDGDVFYSDIFSMQPFKYIMKLTPNIYLGPPQTKPSCNWHLYLISFPPQITEINLRHKVTLKETNTVHSGFWIFKMGLFKSVAMWGCGTLYFDQIQDINTLTIEVNVDILDIYDENGNNIYDFNTFQSPLMITESQRYEWKITDITEIVALKNAKNGTVCDSVLFILHGFEWKLSLYPNGKGGDDIGSVMLCINLNRFLENVSSISFHFELLFVETNTLSSTFAHFNHEFMSTGWTKYRLKTSEIEDLKTFTIRIMIKIVDVYHSNGSVVTDMSKL